MDKIKVLHIMGGIMKRGGTEMFIMNYYRHMNKERYQFDFIQIGSGKGVFDDELLAFGSKIYYIPDKYRHPVLFTRELYKILSSGEYKIVHSEMDAMSSWPLLIAKICRIPVRIAHSHNTKIQSNNIVKIFINSISKIILPYVASDYFACGEDAGKWLFGNKNIKNGRVKIINNAISINDFKFNIEKRNVIRNKLGIDNKLVLGHIGRFNDQKNHRFLIAVFNEVHKVNSDTCLLLVGDGELRHSIEKLVHSLNLQDDIIFLGQIDFVNEIYNALDVFVLPSKFEGQPIVMIEAQTNGVQSIVSNSVPMGDLSINYQVCSLNEKPEVWANTISKMNKSHDEDAYLQMIKLGYDIDDQAKRLEDIYQILLSEQEIGKC